MGSFNLGAFTSGFEGGYGAVRKNQRSKIIDKALEHEVSKMGEEKKAREAGYKRFGKDYASDHEFMPESWGSKLLGKFRGLFGGGDDPQSAISPNDMAPAMEMNEAQDFSNRAYEGEAASQMAPLPGQGGMPMQDQGGMGGMPVMASRHGGAIERYADGGSTRIMAKKYAGGGRARALYSGVKGFSNGGRSLAPNRTIGHYAEGGMAIVPTGYANGGPLQYSGVAGEGGPRATVPRAVGYFADGGRAYTDEERMQRSYGDYYLTEEEAAERVVGKGAGMSGATQPRGRPGPQRQALYDDNTGGGPREALRDVARSASRVFDDTIKGALGGDKLIEDADAKLDKAEGAREIGRATRETGTAALTAAAETTAGLAKDIFVDNPVTQGVLGFFSGDEGDEKTAAVRALDTDEPVNVSGGASQPNPAAPPNQVADAQPKTVAEVIQQEADPIIDMSKVRQIRPEQMPNKGAEEWEEERNFYAAQAVAKGEDPLDAMLAVDQKQLRGFTMYAQQAHQLLRAGDASSAANALYAAYQYFPNGKDVRFGIMKGENGQPVIIGMATNEKTGKETGDPMVMTAESIAVQVEQMSNPAAFKAWTTDHQKVEQEIREWQEGQKPTLQSEAIYRDRMGKAALMKAEALLTTSRSNPHGLKKSDYDRAFGEFIDSQDLRSLQDEPLAQNLASLMSQMYLRNPNTPYPTIIDEVMQALNSDALLALQEKYGLL